LFWGAWYFPPLPSCRGVPRCTAVYPGLSIEQLEDEIKDLKKKAEQDTKQIEQDTKQKEQKKEKAKKYRADLKKRKQKEKARPDPHCIAGSRLGNRLDWLDPGSGTCPS
jgi:hypothetical protein